MRQSMSQFMPGSINTCRYMARSRQNQVHWSSSHDNFLNQVQITWIYDKLLLTIFLKISCSLGYSVAYLCYLASLSKLKAILVFSFVHLGDFVIRVKSHYPKLVESVSVSFYHCTHIYMISFAAIVRLRK